jgi:hypothetical protein
LPAKNKPWHRWQCLAIEVGRSIRALDAIRVLDGAIKGYGQPEHIRSDNGSEFIAEAIRQWMRTLSRLVSNTMELLPSKPSATSFVQKISSKFQTSTFLAGFGLAVLTVQETNGAAWEKLATGRWQRAPVQPAGE